MFWFGDVGVGENDCMRAGGAGEVATRLGRGPRFAHHIPLGEYGKKMNVGLVKSFLEFETKDDDQGLDCHTYEQIRPSMLRNTLRSYTRSRREVVLPR